MDIAPYPCRGRDGAHDGMLRLTKVLGRVLPTRRIAADMAARLAFAKRNPNRSLSRTFLARVESFLWRKILGLQPSQVFTRVFHHIPPFAIVVVTNC